MIGFHVDRHLSRRALGVLLQLAGAVVALVVASSAYTTSTSPADSAGREARAVVIDVEAAPGAETVYNLEVAGYHTYFVGQAQAWVHNACSCRGSVGASKRTVTLHHGSIDNGEEILKHGLDPARTPVSVSRDLAAAEDALAHHYDAVPGRGAIIESRISEADFAEHFAASERPYKGFYPYRLNSSEISMKTPEQIEIFNRGLVRPGAE